MTSEYWQKILAVQIPRRKLLKIAGLGGTALGAAALASACGGGNDGPRSTPAVNISPGRSADRSTPGVTGSPDGQGPSAAATLEATPSTEFINSERAILSLGNLEIAVVGWEEPSIEPPEHDSKVDKVVLIQTIVKNISSNVLTRDLVSSSSSYYGFDLVDREGRYITFTKPFQYLDYGGVVGKPYFTQDGKVFWLDDLAAGSYLGDEISTLPPGFGIPMGLVAIVKKDQNDYGLIVDPRQEGLANPNKVVKGSGPLQADPASVPFRGEIAKDYPLVPPDVHSFGKEASIPGLMDVTLVRMNPGVNSEGISNLSAIFNIINTSDYDLRYLYQDIEVLVYQADGRVVADLAVVSLNHESLDAGESGSFKVILGQQKAPEGYDVLVPGLNSIYKIPDLKQAKVVFLFQGETALWQLP